MAAPPQLQPWTLDVSSLIVLISEDEERNYRLSRRSLLQCLVAAPVVGLQNYVRSYDMLLDTSAETYFSPYGVKSAPLRNIQLSNALKINKILEDGRYTVYKIPSDSSKSKSVNRKSQTFLALWTCATWAFFAGLIFGICKSDQTTWVSLATCITFTGWSVMIRLIEHVNVVPSTNGLDHVNDPNALDAVFIMGRSNSAFVLEGSRKDVKSWTSSGLIYRECPLGLPASVWQLFTRIGSLMVLLSFLTSIPNGSTADQVAFVILNIVAQANVLVGQWANSRCVLSKLSMIESINDPQNLTRTHIYAELIRRFCQAEDVHEWVEASNMLPRTEVWDRWKVQIKEDAQKDPKKLYREISKDFEDSRRAAVSKQDTYTSTESA
ncbi:hypothetical protein GT037_008159 [Alternaria burnsii]|uniref:Uncharacterized protein n=1 Tax=Alternaria burnsii TaxID=1187904 RepID=A0A8H7AXW5_9PLEO|nr:uncharacterized protein GT037_008159 [Alternaria burnsii]KAF7673544.1 hypothetical protein GT037_008159 [Alternaria burnsii]